MNKLLIAASSLLMAILMLFFSCKKEEKSSQEDVLKSLEFADDYYILLEGEKLNLAKNLLFTPESLEDEAEVEWSSEDEDVAVVSSKGKLTAVSKGSTTIYAKSMGKTASCDVLVKRINIQSFSLESDLGEVGVNQKIYLKVNNLTPSNASVSALSWSSSVSSATPLYDVEAGSWYVLTDYVGTIKLTAKNSDGSCTRTCTMNSVVKTLKSITIEPAGLALRLNESASLKAVLSPSDASYQDVTWTSSDESIATVSENGSVMAGSKEGTVTITATHTKKNTKDVTVSATCNVTVSKSPIATAFSLDKSALSLPVSSTDKITIANITPTDADPNTIGWSSSNTDIVTVSAVKGSGSSMPYCTVKAGATPGTATVTASVNGVTKICKVTVTKVEVTDFALSVGDIVLWENTQKAISATFTPSNASDKTITYSSSNKSAVVVEGNYIKAASGANGTYTLTATSSNGKSKSIKVTVLPTESTLLFPSKTFWGAFTMSVDLSTQCLNSEKYSVAPTMTFSDYTISDYSGKYIPVYVDKTTKKVWYRGNSATAEKTCKVSFNCKVTDSNGVSRTFTPTYEFRNSYKGTTGINGTASTADPGLCDTQLPVVTLTDAMYKTGKAKVRIWYRSSFANAYDYVEHEVTFTPKSYSDVEIPLSTQLIPSAADVCFRVILRVASKAN